MVFTGHHEQARETLRAFDADTRAILAIAQISRGDLASAETHVSQAAKNDPRAAKTLHAPGMLCGEIRDPARVAAMVQIALSYYYDGDYLTALAEARQAIEYQPTHALAYRWAAASLGQLGRQAEAAAMLRRVQEV